MEHMSFDELLMRIIKASGLSKEEVLAKINAKVDELSGLVSKQGAAHIIANKFGIQLHESKKGRVLDLKDVVAGLNNVTVKGVVTRVFPVHEFESKGRTGKVASVVLNDGTGEARLVFWNDLTEAISSKRVNESDFLMAYHLRSKKGQYGMELHMSNKSRIQLNPDEEPPKIKSFSSSPRSFERYLICDVQEGLSVELRGCLVQLYDRNPFYDVCPECGKSAKEGSCAEHGEVTPKKALIVNAVFDDGSASIRAVFFKDQAEALLNCSTEQALKLKDEKGDDAAIIHDRQSLLGTEFVLSGRVVNNSFTENLELMVNSVVRADPVVEVKRLMD